MTPINVFNRGLEVPVGMAEWGFAGSQNCDLIALRTPSATRASFSKSSTGLGLANPCSGGHC